MITNALRKKERLCGERAISYLFDKGNSFFQAPYKVFWIKIDHAPSSAERAGDEVLSRFAISVPKRRFKRAVKRNLIKRRTREAFRTNKQILNTVVVAGQIHLMVIYVSDQLSPFAVLEESLKKVLQRIARQYVESI